MSSKQYRKRVKKIVFPHLDTIVRLVKETAKAYEVKRVPMTLVYGIIDRGKLKNMDMPDLQPFFTQFNKTLDDIKSICKEESDIIGDECIAPGQIETMIEQVKTTLMETLNNS